MGYYFYFPPENKIVVARYAEFFEKNLITKEVSGRAINLEQIQDKDTSPSEITSKIPMKVEGFEPPQEEVILIHRSKRTHQAPDHLCLNVEVEEHSLGDLNEPASYKAAMLDLESNKWIDAMNAEIQSMIDNMVWVLVDLPPGSRLVAKVYTQLYEVDYEETFSPVADIRAIRILISISAFYDYEIWKMDVKTAFLNGYHDEDIYVVQPEGFVDPNHPREVCKLQRSIYGLKKALRSWNKRFDEEIKRFGFAQNLDEPCVYQKASGSNVTFLILYVDDIIIMGNHILSLQSVKDYLGKCFAMKDLGEAAFILGIKIYRDRRQGASTPKEVKRMQNVPYASVVGSIIRQGASTPKEVKRMQNVPYASAVGSIINTKDMFLVYGGNPKAKLRVDCYCDDGFETDRDDTKSQMGYVFILNGGAVGWKSSKQSTTVMSATEAEYIAASEAAMEAVWIRKFISGLGVQKGTRHYHMRYHYVRKSIALGEIRFLKVHTDDNLADPFTKALCLFSITTASNGRLCRTDPFVSEGPRSCEENDFIQNGITWAPGLRFRPTTKRFEDWNEENVMFVKNLHNYRLHHNVADVVGIAIRDFEEDTGIQLHLDDTVDLTSFRDPSSGCKDIPLLADMMRN
nr:hypothetical protein [Tanacetum cinerariifolium]